MHGSEASFRADGSCRLVDELTETETTWPSVSEWARQWLAERRAKEYGTACAFIATAGDDAVVGVVDAVIILAETAADEQELAWVGAGPLEHLVSYSGNGMRVLAEVDRAARQNVAFRAALRNVWLGNDVPAPVRDRLSVLGAQIVRGA